MSECLCLFCLFRELSCLFLYTSLLLFFDFFTSLPLYLFTSLPLYLSTSLPLYFPFPFLFLFLFSSCSCFTSVFICRFSLLLCLPLLLSSARLLQDRLLQLFYSWGVAGHTYNKPSPHRFSGSCEMRGARERWRRVQAGGKRRDRDRDRNTLM